MDFFEGFGKNQVTSSLEKFQNIQNFVRIPSGEIASHGAVMIF